MKSSDVFADLPDAEGLRAALLKPFRRAVRLHPRRGQPIGLSGLQPVPWNPAGRFSPDDADPGDFLAYHTGCVYSQDAASQVPVLLLAPQPGDIIIDTCAAPGSKSTQIGLALMRDGSDDGLLVCCDASKPRRAVLAETLARQGIGSAVVTPLPVHRLAERSPGCADGVLVDAPCSGHEERSAKQVARMALRQGELLEHAALLVRPGGRLVYSTCTPYRGENEEVVMLFLEQHPDWRIERQILPGCANDLDGLGAIRLWPQQQGTEPFFAALLRRAGDEPATGLEGNEPAYSPLPWLPHLPAWKRGNAWFLGSRQASSCALPSEARGLIIAHNDKLEPWGAQGLIERGAPAKHVSHAEALRLWAGDELVGLGTAHELLATNDGLPLGALDSSGNRLAMPSRLRRSALR